jgi:chromosome segregation protein
VQAVEAAARVAELPVLTPELNAQNRVEYERLEQALQAARSRVTECENEATAARREISGARERLASLTAQLEATRAQQLAMTTDADRHSDQRERASAEITALRDKLQLSLQSQAAQAASTEEIAQAVRQTQAARDMLAGGIAAGERAARAARVLERERLESGEAIRRRVAELEAELGLLQQRWSESPVSDEERLDIETRYADAPDTVVNEVPKLRDDLARLANVNLNAETEREELAAREGELTGQLDDFSRARELLLDGIRELDETSQTQFVKTFETVRKAFADTYAELFPGGEAHMWLAEPDKPNESGIEISIQPPGKRMTSLASLSGGERAMTAVALIFALIRVKPSPFYLLDEIDAALDEMNVERFSRMVRSLAAESQLLIVTHNKKTMELAQKMYGVTMAEPGLSSIVTASLDREVDRELVTA